MFGDILKEKFDLLTSCSKNKNSPNTFWIVLRGIAVIDIISVKPARIDSDTAIALYYKILKDKINKIPDYYKMKLKSNNQERFRVINRNLWSSNAFHPDGLANQSGIKAYSEINESKKGSRIVFQGE
jgi:hypothetical protein